MTDYIPPTDEVAMHYGMGWFADDDPVQGDPIRNFTRWLRSVQAEAWDEGLRFKRERAPYIDQYTEDNPYRKEES